MTEVNFQGINAFAVALNGKHVASISTKELAVSDESQSVLVQVHFFGLPQVSGQATGMGRYLYAEYPALLAALNHLPAPDAIPPSDAECMRAAGMSQDVYRQFCDATRTNAHEGCWWHDLRAAGFEVWRVL